MQILVVLGKIIHGTRTSYPGLSTKGEDLPELVVFQGDLATDFPPTQPNTPISSPIAAELTSPDTPTPAGPSANLNVRLGKRKRIEVDFDLFVIPQNPKCPKAKVVQSEFAIFMRLDAFKKPGISTEQLQALLTKCACGLVMMRRVYEHHECIIDSNQEIIDLTGDGSESDDQY
ncbi:hypothetical protein PAXINDRAFT_21514 [Paxillus involutus ATCC 200175]|uniref:Uncharacterized protein n=1 Tax=Paxillus involutus ATCC 200175 TaxID=664439 RepID=A0A0C9SLX9_PAXIN|nr:hypothetical protein PAXINDRAFT_21514 [Paxillus involutus ATCC 200175]